MFDPRRGVYSAGGRFENRLRNVVLIPTIQIFNVQIEASFLNERLQEFLNQLRLQIPDARRLELGAVNQVCAVRQVSHHTGERVVQRDVSMAEADFSSSIS